MFKKLRHYLLGNLRRQLITGMALTVSFLVVILIWNITKQHQKAADTQHTEQVHALADALATSSALWVVSRDYSGLQETVGAVAHYPNLYHVIVLGLNGLVLAHGDPSKVGLYMTDLPSNPKLNELNQSISLIDLTKPIMLADKHIGWVRVGLGREAFNAEIAKIRRDGVIYALFAILLSTLITTLASHYLTRRLYAIQRVANAVQSGESKERVLLTGEDETTVLASQFNIMLDSLAQREMALVQSELKFRRLYDSTSDAIMLADERGFIDCNVATLKLFGCATVKEFCTYHPADLSPPKQPSGTDSMTLARYHIANAIENGGDFFEWIHKRVDNNEVFHTEVLLNYMNFDGEFVVQATVRDITERKRVENAMRIAATAFESQEGMMVTDAKSVILRVNQAFTIITGYSAEEAIGNTPHLLNSGKQDKAFYRSMWDSLKKIGTWEGEIWNKRKSGEVYPQHLTITTVKDVAGIVTNYVATLTDITISKAASEEIKHLAFYDSLTKLPNRRLFLDRLKQALASSARSGQHGALLFMDLDHFKTLNDTLGHDVGDLLLQQVATRLTASVREGDTVARLGGDEFVVLLEDLSEAGIEAATQTRDVAEKIIATLNQPYQLNTHTHHSTPSIGATVFNGHEQATEELLKQSDIAMYQSKTEGRNTLRFFDPKMQEAITARVDMEHELRKAIEQSQFQLHYQIQIGGDEKATGAEVLIRWQHPERGMISPFHFIPLAEETGLILPIGQWVLDTACAQLKSWQQNPLTRGLVISINVSAKQFRQENFVEQVLATIQRHAINPALLKLELTESMLIDNVNDIISKMGALNGIGVRFSLDDFGTGYSSLQYLKKLPLDQLKIDQSFVRDIVTDSSDRAIVRTIITMAHSLNINVIAEGVETAEQRQYLSDNGCIDYQGYLFGRPMPIDAFEATLTKN